MRETIIGISPSRTWTTAVSIRVGLTASWSSGPVSSCVEALLGYQGPEMAKNIPMKSDPTSHFGPCICSIDSQILPVLALSFFKEIHLDIYDRWDIWKKKRPKEINEQNMARLLHLQNLFQSLGFKTSWVKVQMWDQTWRWANIWAPFYFFRQCSKATATDFWVCLVCQTQKPPRSSTLALNKHTKKI